MAETVEDLKVWQRATELCVAIDAIIDRPGFLGDRRLREQLRDASDSIVSNIVEGFQQSTDRGFAKYLYTSKGSTAEVRARLQRALDRKYNSQEEFHARNALREEVAKMTTGLKKYLLKSDRKGRGLGRRRPSTPRMTDTRLPTTTDDD